MRAGLGVPDHAAGQFEQQLGAQRGASRFVPQIAQLVGVVLQVVEFAPGRAGLPAYNGMQGASMLPLMSGAVEALRDAVLIEEEGQRTMFGFAGRTRMRTLQTARHRLSVYALSLIHI